MRITSFRSLLKTIRRPIAKIAEASLGIRSPVWRSRAHALQSLTMEAAMTVGPMNSLSHIRNATEHGSLSAPRLQRFEQPTRTIRLTSTFTPRQKTLVLSTLLTLTQKIIGNKVQNKCPPGCQTTVVQGLTAMIQ